jgi:hypothetical protein
MKKKGLTILSRILLILALCFVVGTVACNKGGSEEPSKPSSSGSSHIGDNQPPVISSLTAAQSSVAATNSTEIRCVASDPDGDKVRYTWSTNGGKFSGTTNESLIVWVAPSQYGDYEVTVEVEDGKGGSVNSTVVISVIANQNPVITDLVAKPNLVGLGGSSIITCAANDPDGDTVRFTWSASDGDITGVGDEITWMAPRKTGTFEITVVVSDGKGGESKNNVLVTVGSAMKTETITTIHEETGTVSPNDKDLTKTRAGDDSKETPYRAFWSFNIFSLQRTEIKEAKLIFGPSEIVGEPFTKVGSNSLNGLKLLQVKYGEGLPNYNIIGTGLSHAQASMFTQPTIVDVTEEVAWQVKSGAKRFQIEALFGVPNNGNGISEWIQWSDLVLEVSYTE